MFDEKTASTSGADLSHLCRYCSEPICARERPGILCQKCARKVHVNCLSEVRVPSALVGDVFFELSCRECSGAEQISRPKMQWFKVLVLTLYNLRARSDGISKNGYFHWKSDIVSFIDRNWDNLFDKQTKKKKNWYGTISSMLSQHSNIFFLSGTSELGKSGWWKLIDSDPPEILAARHEKLVAERRKCDNPSKNIAKSYSSPAPSESSLSIEEDSNFSMEIYRSQSSSTYTQTPVPPSEILSDFLMTEDDLQDIDSPDIDEDTDFDHVKMFGPSLTELMNNIKNEDSPMSRIRHMSFSFNDIPLDDFDPDVKVDDSEDQNFEYNSDSPHLDDVSIKQEYMEQDLQDVALKLENENFAPMDELEGCSESNQDADSVQENVLPSLFNVYKQREWPWKKFDSGKQSTPCTPMSVQEELHLLRKIETHKHRLHLAPPSVRRLYRKLVVRKWKRENNLPILDVDSSDSRTDSDSRESRTRSSILDCFMGSNVFVPFEQRLQGHYEPTAIYSPYTNRVLRPFIRRDTKSRSVWLNVMQELLARTNKNNPDWSPPEVAPIDYSYVRPQHIPAMNSLVHQFFWPGIDLSDCLQYPDFTCVVLYKKLVIGFAVMVPDVGINEAYISFILTRPEWRNAKIGTFMLYHLIQTCMGKDITLHVSASNPAVFLYAKFGFKLNEFVHNFYDKYLSPNSRESRHALFLRLSR